MQNANEATRSTGIDVARALGMLLVYYGHFVEQIMYLGNTAAASHYKCIYSFHMIFFFVVSGWTGGRKDPRPPFRRFLSYRLASRLVPYLAFSIVLALLAQFIPGWYPLADVRTGAGFTHAAISTILGFPLFNIPMWFVGALISVECCHYLITRLGDTRTIIVATCALFVAGMMLNAHYFALEKGFVFWLVNEVPVVYAFYLLGVHVAKYDLLSSFTARTSLLLAIGCALVVLLTYDANHGPFRIIQAVVILLGSHGQPIWFIITALAGSSMLLGLGHALSASRVLAYLGRNSLLLLGLNGVFYHFVNAPVAKWFTTNLSASGWSVLLFSCFFTLLCITLGIPVIEALNRSVPQLLGRPKVKGPLLPALWQ